jgi:predicted TIM-barrel fold metal-dependent hydrolase
MRAAGWQAPARALCLPATTPQQGGTAMAAIDSDAHVLETPETWRYLRENEQRHAPFVVVHKDDEYREAQSGHVMREYWVVDGRLHNKQLNVGYEASRESREMSDVRARLAHMDALEIDVQVLYPTLFLRPWTRNLDVEYALCRSYNRWLAELSAAAPDRLRWVAAPPLMSMHRVREELEFAKAHGACGVFMRGVECERMLSDSYFHPLYEIATELDLPICLHSGTNSFALHEFFREDPGFNRFKLATIGAFHVLILDGTTRAFPKLRWAFIEVSAQWLPYAVNDLALRAKRRGMDLPDNLLAAHNIWVACQVTDDLDYVLRCAGPDNLVIGTDYGHNDTSAEIEALRRLRSEGAIPREAADRILDANARALYGLN